MKHQALFSSKKKVKKKKSVVCCKFLFGASGLTFFFFFLLILSNSLKILPSKLGASVEQIPNLIHSSLSLPHPVREESSSRAPDKREY